MQNIEKEIKILDIDTINIIDKLKELNIEYLGKKDQKLYVYDLNTIYYRFLEIKELIKSKNNLIVNTNIKRFNLLFKEIYDLLEDKYIEELENKYNLCLDKELNKDEILLLIKDKEFNKTIKKYMINPNKWIRLRKYNDKTELTIKHIIKKDNDFIEKVIENEIETNNFDKTNIILESLGITNRGYQEKTRFSYIYKDASIEIDFWPKLNPYIEIECDNTNTIDELINILELNNKEIVSFNTEKLYKRINVNLKEDGDLKFNKNELNTIKLVEEHIEKINN